MTKYTKFGKFITVQDTKKDAIEEVDRVEVSWASLGAVSIEEAETFLKDLSDAIKLANDVNFVNIKNA